MGIATPDADNGGIAVMSKYRLDSGRWLPGTSRHEEAEHRAGRFGTYSLFGHRRGLSTQSSRNGMKLML
jgi:hypothetical protein